MHLNSYLKVSRHGIYYLRVQRGGMDRRVSLRTRNPSEAAAVAYQFGYTMSQMSDPFDPDLTSKIERALADFRIREVESQARIDAMVRAAIPREPFQPSPAISPITAAPVLRPTCLRDAATEYFPMLEKSGDAAKSIKMAKSTLNKVVDVLGADFDMSKFVDEEVEKLWMQPRKQVVAGSTVKKELSFVRSFSAWAADSKRMYAPSPLTLTIRDDESKSQHREYFRADDLKKIFDSLPTAARHPWHLWIPLIGLYTGARIGEPAALRVEHFFEKAGLSVMHLPGTKTDCAPRDVPIHPDLIELGLLHLVEARRSAGKEYLFDITKSGQNGFGAAPSKWFGAFLRDTVKISDRNKVFHSFRHTLVDHLRQHDASPEARMQYVGHSTGGSSHAMYGREPLGLPALQARVVDNIDWQKYCGWSPNLATLKARADAFIK